MTENIEIKKKLVEIGLSEPEVKVYLTMLSLGETTVMKIASLSGVKRSTVYTIIERLRNQGLVSIRNRGFKTVYFAESPKRLATMISRKQEDLMSILPALETMRSSESKDIFIKTYEGIEALKSVYDELLGELKSHDEYLVFGDPERWDQHERDYFKKYIKRRLKIDLDVRSLLSYSARAEEYRKFQRNFKEQVRLLPEGYVVDWNVVITKNKIVMHQMDNPVITIVIESRSVISLLKNLFEVLWNFCE